MHNKIGSVVACSFERGGQMHHHSGRVVRSPWGLHPGEVKVRLFRPMRDAKPNTAEQHIVLWEEELRTIAPGAPPVHEVRIIHPKIVRVPDSRFTLTREERF